MNLPGCVQSKCGFAIETPCRSCQKITKRSAFVGRAALLLNSRVRGATIVPEISCARETIFYDIRFTDDEESTNSRAIGRH